MAAVLIQRFRTFEAPPPVPEALANVEANQRVPWWRRGGMGVFEHGALLTEFVPAVVLQRTTKRRLRPHFARRPTGTAPVQVRIRCARWFSARAESF